MDYLDTKLQCTDARVFRLTLKSLKLFDLVLYQLGILKHQMKTKPTLVLAGSCCACQCVKIVGIPSMYLSMNQKIGEGKLDATVSEQEDKRLCYYKKADLRAYWLDSNACVAREGVTQHCQQVSLILSYFEVIMYSVQLYSIIFKRQLTVQCLRHYYELKILNMACFLITKSSDRK